MWGILSNFVRWTDVNVIATAAYICWLLLLVVFKYIFQWADVHHHPWIKQINTLCYFIVMWTTMSCTLLFWFIYHFKFELINSFSKEQLDNLPPYAHHIGHTVPILIAFAIGIFIYRPTYMPHYRWVHILVQCILITIYFINMKLIQDRFKYWPYPFMNLMSTHDWIGLILFAFVVSTGFFEPLISYYFNVLNKSNQSIKQD